MMKHALIAILFVTFILPAMLFAEDNIRWISFPDSSFEVNGLAWFDENTPIYSACLNGLKGSFENRYGIWRNPQAVL